MPKWLFLTLTFILIGLLITAGVACNRWNMPEGKNETGQLQTGEPSPRHGATQQSLQIPTPESISTALNGEPVIRGSVIENNLGCEVDATCYLRLRFDDQELVVVYHYGEWPPCLNEEAAEQGMALSNGDEVEIFGKVVNLAEISTCDSTDYYIRKLQ